ncbi:related to ZAP1-metalloregulatory protein involved in zinc-responsive transcriptional regulation [Sporisorium scitamineum]|uniref:Related to ZAP1-metalloregulatory protein involved in zinc-responsive transcriptional regulation n=1 Tax=Sporisorium scitamineum TaxID=49012 RepID=A0A127ZEF6_9BASI|nr:related to ZAP1-metalloregulatory protein involved in zinc-responsive transcriptional regulation [Sporisorium scitamineum]
MAPSTEGVLSAMSLSSRASGRAASTTPLASKHTSSVSPASLQSKQQHTTLTPPCNTVVCCDANHSAPPVSCATECHGFPTSAPASPCSDIHHISSACAEPSCGAATSSAAALVCSSAVACCGDTACADVPDSPCSQSSCSVAGDCSSMTLAVPTLATCCTDEACETDASLAHSKDTANVCNGIVQPSSKAAHTHTNRSTSQSHNECRDCRGSLTSTGTAEGGQLYSSFQELLDCCCCSMPPSVDKCCVGSTPYPCNAPHTSPADTVSPAGHHQSHAQDTAPPPPPPSDTPSSSIITNATQYTSPGGSRHQIVSRASTVSNTATPQPVAASPSSTLPWTSSMLHSSPFPAKDKSSGMSAFDNHHHHSPAGTVSFEDILSELQSWNDCMFEQPHLHSSHGGCLPPAMTLCNSDICHTTAPHSHWIPTSTMQQQQQQHTPNALQNSGGGQQDARPQLCQWGGCNERFWTVEELVAHVNHSHLARKNAVTDGVQQASLTDNSFLASISQGAKPVTESQIQSNAETQSGAGGHLECLWKDCHQVPLPGKPEFGTFTPNTEEDLWKTHDATAAEAGSQDDKMSLAILQHLLHDHLGQQSAAPFSLKGHHAHFAPPTPSSPYKFGDAALSSNKDSVVSTWAGKKRKSSQDSSGISSNSSNSGASCSDSHQLHCRWQGCSATFDTHSALTEHIELEHVGSGKAEYECRWVGCARHASGQKFSQKQKVLRHIQTHTGDRPFKCTECGKRFSEQNTLAQHMRTHTLERPYVCDYPGCGKAFSVAGSLTIHKRTHTGSKPFVCSFPGCGKAFAESSNLTKHVRTHTGDKPFRCDECGKCFSRPDQASRHRKTHERKRVRVAEVATGKEQQGQAVGGLKT